MKHLGLSSSQQYTHYPSLNSLQNEVFIKKNDSNVSNKLLQSIDNEPLQQPDNSRLQSQSSLVNNNKDRESIPKHNEQHLNQYFGGVGVGSSNQQNEQLMNCFRMNSQLSNQSITNNGSLKKHMHNLSNMVDQNCGEQDQDDSIRHLRSDFQGRRSRYSEKARKRNLNNSQVSEPALNNEHVPMMLHENQYHDEKK